MKNINIRVATKVTTSEGIIFPKNVYKTYKTRNVKYYAGYEKSIYSLQPSEFMLIHYLLGVMSKENVVVNNAKYRAKFIEDVGADKYKDITVKMAFKSLTDKKLLSRIKRGVLRVSPIIWYSGSEEDRKLAIETFLIETGEALSWEQIIAEAEEQKKSNKDDNE